MSEQSVIVATADDPVARAKAFLSEVSENQYGDWVQEDLKVLLAAYRNFHHSPNEETVRVLTGAFQALQDLGGTFDYPLVSEIGIMAVRFLEADMPKDDKEMEIVHILTEAMELVVTQKMAGDGGAGGQSLLKNIHAALGKVRHLEVKS